MSVKTLPFSESNAFNHLLFIGIVPSNFKPVTGLSGNLSILLTVNELAAFPAFCGGVRFVPRLNLFSIITISFTSSVIPSAFLPHLIKTWSATK